MLDRILSFVVKIPLVDGIMTYATKRSFRIVYYHMISDSPLSYYFDTQLSEANFVKQIKWFKKHFNIISLEEALARLEANSSLDGYLSITFDDGFRECYDIVAPILLEEKITSTFFLITDCLDNKKLMWRNRLLYIINNVPKNKIIKLISEKPAIGPSTNLLKDSMQWGTNDKETFADFLWDGLVDISQNEWLEMNRPYMSTKQVKELLNTGFFIGSHTKSHPHCDRLNYNQFEEEVMGSIRYLEQKFSTKVLSFAYPFGDRAKKEYEIKISNQTHLKMMLGVRDRLSNINYPLDWERIGMENKNAHSKFFFRPINQLLQTNRHIL